MSGVLVINADYVPLGVIPIRRAVVLTLTDKAEVLHESEEELFRSAKLTFAVPTVIRLTTWVKVPYKARIPLNRRAVLTRDDYICGYCGKHATTIDHIIPRSRGGEHTWLNLVAACKRCNQHKGNRLLHELEWTLQIVPKTPSGTMWMVIGRRVDPSWVYYLDPVIEEESA